MGRSGSVVVVESSSGARLALLLIDGFTAMVEDVVDVLAEQGHPGVTATLEFALHAIDDGASDASALGRRLGVSKQAAAKSIAALEQLGYVERVPHPKDARRKQLRVTTRGYEMSTLGGAAFDDLRERLRRSIGTDRLETVEAALTELARGRRHGGDAPAGPTESA